MRLAQIGVILLMFIAGLETDVQEFKRNGKASTFVGFGGIIFPLALGYFAGILLHLTTIESLVFRVAALRYKCEYLRSSS